MLSFFVFSTICLFILNYIITFMILKDNLLFTYKETLILMIPFLTLFLFVICMFYIMFEDIIDKLID